ncbi:MAG: FAD-dependent monooxygenase, partial [Pseudomonadota bacterium]
MQHEVDIAIIGAGPAGAALASALAGAYRVLLIDRWEKPPQKIGESLIPAARRLLRDLHLLDAVAARGYPDYVGNRSYWGSVTAETRDFIRDPDGLGWHLDREDFDLMLRQEAVRRGAHLLAPARLGEVVRDGGRWSVSADTRDGTHTVRSR